ncbi:MAG: DeoR/GlpR family DNA-binding transcription regulator [Oscillospiraceae bacterium]|nr:DeoR/GlpR family DNA-binding transcription regulator [Oscillospiraceae bacterium]
MKKSDRFSLIRTRLQKEGIVSIDDMKAFFQTSKATIYRDLRELESLGELKCTRGGAVSVARKANQEFSYEKKVDLFQDEKIRIAHEALKYIHPKETIILDSGTTVFELARLISGQKEEIYAATNDILTAHALACNEYISLTVLGGFLRKNHFSLNGYFAESMISQMHADTAFIGADAIDLSIGFMNFSVEEIQTKKLMIKASKKRIFLCDHTKFDSIAFVNICPFADADIIITGQETSPTTVHELEAAGVHVALV